MVSAEEYPLQSLVAAALLLSPIAGAVWMLSGSPFIGFAAAALAGLAWNWPEGMLWALVASAPILRSGNSAMLPPMLMAQLKTAAVLLLGVIWMARKAVSREQPARGLAQDSGFPSWVMAFLGIWTALTGLAVLHSVELRASLEYLSFSAAGCVVFCMSFDLDRKQKRAVLWTILALGGVIGALVMLQYLIVVYHVATFLERFIVEPRTQAYYSSNLTPLAAGRYRPTGTMSHPNMMGLYFAILIPFACALISIRGLRGRYRLALVLGAVAMALGLYATNSRAAIVFLIVALAYLSWHRGYRWLAGLAGGALALGLGLLMLSPSEAGLKEAILSKARVEYGLSGRLTVWENTLDLVRQTPVLGVGPGNFSRQYVSNFGYFTPNDASEQAWQIWALQTQGQDIVKNFHSHNTYLQLLGELGVAGPLLFLAALCGVMIHCERLGRFRAERSYLRALALATAANAAGLLIYGMFDSQLAFTLGSLNLLAAALLAFGLKSDRKEPSYAS